jgi:hypothetical protein
MERYIRITVRDQPPVGFLLLNPNVRSCPDSSECGFGSLRTQLFSGTYPVGIFSYPYWVLRDFEENMYIGIRRRAAGYPNMSDIIRRGIFVWCSKCDRAKISPLSVDYVFLVYIAMPSTAAGPARRLAQTSRDSRLLRP